MKKWGWLDVVYNLCNGDITKADDILQKPYVEIFNWLSLIKDRGSIER